MKANMIPTQVYRRSPEADNGLDAKAEAPARRSRRRGPGELLAPLAPEQPYVLQLYVAGFTTSSVLAISNLKEICEEHLKGRYELDVVDIYQQPGLAQRAQIIATPTLIRHLPGPLRRIVGDMSCKQSVLLGLGLLPRG